MTTQTLRPFPSPHTDSRRTKPNAATASPVEFHLSLALRRHRREQSVVDLHRPGRRRLRIARFAGFPVPALVLRCDCCGAVWPCRELLGVLRAKVGWTAQIDKLDQVLDRLRRDRSALGAPPREVVEVGDDLSAFPRPEGHRRRPGRPRRRRERPDPVEAAERLMDLAEHAWAAAARGAAEDETAPDEIEAEARDLARAHLRARRTLDLVTELRAREAADEADDDPEMAEEVNAVWDTAASVASALESLLYFTSGLYTPDRSLDDRLRSLRTTTGLLLDAGRQAESFRARFSPAGDS
ncbi:hypothetical protein AB0I28_33220 [Phytomonospora sp. NPDC050363]|uniref:hypothetical protein n=1 Tax=Phytomonospora sp. NPDC050363 TaxID=3155642 RepID=UPI0033BFD71D